MDIFIFIEVKMHFNDRPVGPAAGSQRKSHWPVGPAAGSERVKKVQCFLIFTTPYNLPFKFSTKTKFVFLLTRYIAFMIFFFSLLKSFLKNGCYKNVIVDEL